MIIRRGDGTTEYGPGVSIELTWGMRIAPSLR
jgi:hypothetical protein